MGATIYAVGASPAEQALTAVAEWVSENRMTAWLAAGAVVLVLLVLGTYRIVGTIKGRARSAKAAVGYAVVQTGMAYVTVTGGYDFWHLVAHMPSVEAAALAVIVEATQWAVLAKTFEWMAARNPDGSLHVGYGTAGRYFWIFVSGGGLVAVLGALVGQGNVPLAIGRTVVVVIGSLLWDLLLRDKMNRDPSIPPTVLLLTWRRLGIRLGIMAAEQKDVQTQNREWLLRRMSRALRWKNEGHRLLKWLGDRYLMRAMDAGDAGLLTEAVQRYAMNWLIRNEITATHKTMGAALEAARKVLAVLPVTAELPPVERPKPRPRPELVEPRRDPTPATVAATARLRDSARAWALEQLRSGVRVTGSQVAQQFDMKDEWGRCRLVEAKRELAETNGHSI